MKYPIYMSLSYNSPDFQYMADIGSGDFQYTCPRASCEQRACPWHAVSIGIGIRSQSNLNSLLSPSRRREAPCEGTTPPPQLFTPGETKAIAKSKVHHLSRAWVTNGVGWVVILTDLKNMADCHE
jgi:hypothetical protein